MKERRSGGVEIFGFDAATEDQDSTVMMVRYPKLPQGWHPLVEANDGAAFENKANGLRVIVSISLEQDQELWLHVSLSRKSRVPSYEDLTLIKHLFIGDERSAIMVLPEQAKHVNIHPNCLHLFSCLSTNPLPDFTRGTGSI